MEFVETEKVMRSLGGAIVARTELELNLTRDRQSRRTSWKKAGPNKWQVKRTIVRKRKGRITATGRLAQSFNFKVKGNPDGEGPPVLEIWAEDYAQWVDQGRPPTNGSGPGILQPKIRQWTYDKRIRPRKITPKGAKFIKDTKQARDTMAFLMTRSIHHFGYKGTNFISDSLNGTIPKFEEALQEAITKDITDLLP
jgi:hypothetical protein